LAESGTKPPELDDVDSGWEDADDVDSGWEDAEAPATPATIGPASRELPAGEREAAAVRGAKRKDRLRAKAAEKAERRKARETAAAARQKKSSPRAASAPRATGSERGARRRVEERRDALEPLPIPHAPPGPGAPSAAMRRRTVRLAVLLVLLLVVSCVIAFVLARR
jgi:hypothetical protein